ncbi:IS607 family transposase, partial [Candidatus Chloroploca sp. Khr17]|uniref:IS607 family transposase n=1 Tax=Candidatus Chloroploca sp. Khr17 TaxID=2496869 RepID=UPI00101D5BC9
MKLSDYAKKVGVRYETAWRWFQAGTIRGHQLPTGTIIITEDEPTASTTSRVAIYARVSAAENKPNLNAQADRLVGYGAAKGYQVHVVVKEVGSGVNDSRPKFLKLLADPAITHIVVEHKDRATRFGFRYIETLLVQQGRSIEVVNQAENGKEDLLTDLVAIVSSFAAR